MTLEVLKKSGDTTGRHMEVPSSLLDGENHPHVIYLEVKRHLAALRQGTHKTKERGEVKGSTRKIRKQKGTGAARAGDIKNPIFRGGGTIFGPRADRNYTLKINKKTRQLARNLLLGQRLKQKVVSVVEDFSFDKPKTKDYLQFLSNLGLQNKRSLLVLTEADKNIYLSGRNEKKAKVVLAESLNSYDLIHSQHVIFFENALKKLPTLWTS